MSLARRHFVALPLLALLPLLLYAVAGYGGHDFKFHAASWLELHQAWRAHPWSLGWSQWAQYGFGEPRFAFYPPLSLLLGTGLTFLLPFRFVPAAVVWLLFTLSGASMYVAAGRLVDERHRFQAAVLYMFNPYLLITVVIRFAIAEAWVQAILPLVFACFYMAVAHRRWQLTGLAGCLLAACWLTNIPEAIGIFYAFGVLSLVLAWRQRSWAPILIGAAAQTMALLLSAFRLGPAFEEKAWVTSASLLIYNFRSSMQLRRVPPPHLVVYLCALYIALTIGLMLPAVRQASPRQGQTGRLTSLVTLAAFAILFQLPITTLLWEKLPEFKFILFPYRLLALLSLAVVLLLFEAGVSTRLQAIAGLCFACFAVVPFAAYTRLLPMQRFPSIAMAAAQNCNAAVLEAKPNSRQIATASAADCTLTLNTYFYPFWRARLENGAELPVRADDRGLLTIALPPGRHRLTLRFVPASAMRTWSAALSVSTLLLVSLASFLMLRRPGGRDALRPALVAADSSGQEQAGALFQSGGQPWTREAS